MIEDYADEVARWLVGAPAEVADRRAELVAHLYEAQEAGELDAALARLGPARDAAAIFSAAKTFGPAPWQVRAKAAAVDLSPLFLVSLVALVMDIADGPGFSYSFPPVMQFNEGRPVLAGLLIVAAIWATIIVLGVMESRDGRTPGKAIFGLRVVTVDGGGLSRGQALLRRAVLLGGPLAWGDCLAVFFNDRGQRLTDMMTHTMVIHDPQRSADGHGGRRVDAHG